MAYSDLSGTLDTLRGGTDVVGRHKVRFVAARVVRDITADGTRKQGARSSVESPVGGAATERSAALFEACRGRESTRPPEGSIFAP